MKKLLLIAVFSLLTICVFSQRQIKPGMLIRQSMRFKKASYHLPVPSDSSRSLLVIEGNNLTIDFGSAELIGGEGKTPDQFTGTAILIQNSKRVTIRNLKANGYKVALLARNVQQLVIENCDFSYNYRQHLASTQEKEDLADWMSYHHNENDQWLRYGAAIYLRGCDQAVISASRVTGGQNALLMTECNYARIYNNEFSFNSGIGIGLFRCSNNIIAFNKVDFNVRGYSHGVYQRGQDSAGILVYEQSSKNFFYRNSVTHGGDGFFLWAGQTTMDNGTGGCNDNVLLENDFSYAPTNGIEVTFSRNFISHNRIFECDHGIWGGYSYDTRISDNQFRDNRIAIAIEHGQRNEILFNIFSRDKEAIRLWANARQPADWGYARFRDTRSVGSTIAGNSFNGNETVVSLARTDSIRMFTNTYAGYQQLFKTDSTVGWIDSTEYELPDSVLTTPVIPRPMDPFRGNGKLAGRKNILLTEWGPYDFRSPLIWLTNPMDSSGHLQFDLLGPAGRWKVKSINGVGNLSADSGSIPGKLSADRLPGPETNISIELEYAGEAVTTAFGRQLGAGQAVPFSFRKYFHPVNWNVSWFPLDTALYNPVVSNRLFQPNARIGRIKGEERNQLDYAWWGGLKGDQGILYKQFITTADGQSLFDGGEYEIGVTWDDAVRVYVDGKLMIDEWNPSKYLFDESPHRSFRVRFEEGRHFLRVEHLELGGFACLSLKINKVE